MRRLAKQPRFIAMVIRLYVNKAFEAMPCVIAAREQMPHPGIVRSEFP